MDYVSVAEAKDAGGLRIALTAGGPAVWSEAAKGLFHIRKVDFTAVAQMGGGLNEELVAWTGHRNAPTAVYENEVARTTSPELVALAERLGSGPSLVPADIDDRVLMFGLVNELAGENGYGWSVRVMMIAGMVAAVGEEAASANPMLQDYHFSPEQVSGSLAKVDSVLQALNNQLDGSGGKYFFGEAISALDVYWACFSQMLAPLPADVNPMPETMRAGFEGAAKAFEGAGFEIPSSLIEHRDFVYPNHLKWPLDF